MRVIVFPIFTAVGSVVAVGESIEQFLWDTRYDNGATFAFTTTSFFQVEFLVASGVEVVVNSVRTKNFSTERC